MAAMSEEPAAKRVKTDNVEACEASVKDASSPSKVAVVTGAGSGVGRAAALALAPDFKYVVLVGRRLDRLEETKRLALAKDASAKVELWSGDLTNPKKVQELFSHISDNCGRCDLLFNNAGVGAPPTPLEDLSLDAWQRCVDTNLTATFLCTQAAFKLMKAQKPRGGRIINNGSVSADRPRPLAAAYTATKHAVTGLTKSTALEGRAHDIACGQIDIGNALTEMSAPLQLGALQPTMDGSERRLAEPVMDVENVARAIQYMASLPLDCNVLFMNVMATKMPLVGRG